jgi:hypothetical protein
MILMIIVGFVCICFGVQIYMGICTDAHLKRKREQGGDD